MDKIRDLRDKFFQIDDEYLNGYAKLCGINATGVYLSMCRHANKEQQCFPSKKLIAEELAISERSVYTAIKKLEEWKIILVKEQGRKENGAFKNLLYTLLNKKHWKIKPSANGAVGNRCCQPSATGAVDRRQQVPNKETHSKETHSKETHIFVGKPINSSFDTFWSAYPTKELKKRSKEIWKAKKLENVLPKILEFIKLAKETDRWQKGYIKQPPTFLNGECWEDDLTSYGRKITPMATGTPFTKGKFDNVDEDSFINNK